MGLPLSAIRDVGCPICGASPGSACVRIDAQNGGGQKRTRMHGGRVQAAGRQQSTGDLAECRPTSAVLAEAMEAVLEGHPEKSIKLATNPAGDQYVRAAYLIDAVAPEMSARAAAFISRSAAAGHLPVSLARGQYRQPRRLLFDELGSDNTAQPWRRSDRLGEASSRPTVCRCFYGTGHESGESLS